MSTDITGGRWGMLFLGGSLAAGLIIATHLATRSLMFTKLVEQNITVKGYAEKQIVSDRANWTATFMVNDAKLVEANKKLETDRNRIQAFLDRQGVDKAVIQSGPVMIESVFKKDENGRNTNEVERYRLSQQVEVSTPDVRLIEKIARASAELIEQGVELHADKPQYIYTKLNELKSDLLAQATSNAKECAGQIAAHSGSAVGGLRSAHQGVFQITPVYSTEVSDSGENDSGSLEKIVRAVVTVEFAVQ